jgi:hypothetical protein
MAWPKLDPTELRVARWVGDHARASVCGGCGGAALVPTPELAEAAGRGFKHLCRRVVDDRVQCLSIVYKYSFEISIPLAAPS